MKLLARAATTIVHRTEGILLKANFSLTFHNPAWKKSVKRLFKCKALFSGAGANFKAPGSHLKAKKLKYFKLSKTKLKHVNEDLFFPLQCLTSLGWTKLLVLRACFEDYAKFKHAKCHF